MDEQELEQEQEKRVVKGYEITHSIRIGEREVVFGVNPQAQEPYLCALYHEEYQIIQYKDCYEHCFISDNYIEMMELFAQYVKEQCAQVREMWASITVPHTVITEDMCVPCDKLNLVDKVVAIKPDVFYPEYRSAHNQLMLVTGGFGSMPNARGTSCATVELYSGKNGCCRRYDILGVIKPECLPDWAKGRLAEIKHEQAEKAVKNHNSREER